MICTSILVVQTGPHRVVISWKKHLAMTGAHWWFICSYRKFYMNCSIIESGNGMNCFDQKDLKSAILYYKIFHVTLSETTAVSNHWNKPYKPYLKQYEKVIQDPLQSWHHSDSMGLAAMFLQSCPFSLFSFSGISRRVVVIHYATVVHLSLFQCSSVNLKSELAEAYIRKRMQQWRQ